MKMSYFRMKQISKICIFCTARTSRFGFGINSLRQLTYVSWLKKLNELGANGVTKSMEINDCQSLN